MRPKALSCGQDGLFGVPSILHPQEPHNHFLASLWFLLQLFSDHILVLLSLLSLHSPFSSSLMCFCLPFCCFQVPVIGCISCLEPSHVSLLCVSQLPDLTQLALKTLFLCCSDSLVISNFPTSSLQDTHHPQAVQADNPSWILPWLCWQSGIWLLFHPQ